jgi:hypothetical protein
MGLNEAQELRFMDLYDSVARQVASGARTRKKGGSKWDRLSGEAVVGIDAIPDLTIESMTSQLDSKFLADAKGADKVSWLKVRQLLYKLKRFGIFDTTKDTVSARELLKPGQLSVFDLSDSTNVRINNIVIAEILRLIFQEKIQNASSPPTMILIEEAHTFVRK